MAGAKRRPLTSTRKKRRSASSAPSPRSIRFVLRPAALGASDLARELGVTASTVRRRARSGLLAGFTLDARGRYRFDAIEPVPRRQKKKLLSQKKRPVSKKKRPLPRKKLPPPPPPRKKLPPPPPPRKKRPAPLPPAPPARKKKRRPVAGKKKRLRPPRAEASTVPAYEPRPVTASDSPTIDDAARLFRLSPDALEAQVAAGAVRAVIDEDGILHIPQASLQARTWRSRIERQKRRERNIRRRERDRATRAARKKAKKAKKAGKKAKKKRARKTRPRVERFEAAVESDFAVPDFNPFTGERLHQPEPTVSRAQPMPLQRAIEYIGPKMSDFLMARRKDDRLATGATFRGLKAAFRATYGVPAWRDAYDDIVDDWGLDDYIIDYDALRDS